MSCVNATITTLLDTTQTTVIAFHNNIMHRVSKKIRIYETELKSKRE